MSGLLECCKISHHCRKAHVLSMPQLPDSPCNKRRSRFQQNVLLPNPPAESLSPPRKIPRRRQMTSRQIVSKPSYMPVDHQFLTHLSVPSQTQRTRCSASFSQIARTAFSQRVIPSPGEDLCAYCTRSPSHARPRPVSGVGAPGYLVHTSTHAR